MPNSADSEKAVVFFVHVMKTGGTTALQSLRNTYPAGALYPDGALDILIETKGNPQALFALSPARRAGLQCVAPHVPYSAAQRLRHESDIPVYTTLVLRDGLERALSHLRQVARRFDYRYSYRELIDLPLLGNFFLADHQTRALSAAENNWPLWEQCFSALAMLDLHLQRPASSFPVERVTRADLERATQVLDEVDVLGLQSNFDAWWQQCHTRFGWPVAPVASVNVAAALEPTQAPPIPEDVIQELRERNRLDTQLHAAAKKFLEQQA